MAGLGFHIQVQHPGACGRFPQARRGQVLWRFFVPPGGGFPPSGARSRRLQKKVQIIIIREARNSRARRRSRLPRVRWGLRSLCRRVSATRESGARPRRSAWSVPSGSQQTLRTRSIKRFYMSSRRVPCVARRAIRPQSCRAQFVRNRDVRDRPSREARQGVGRGNVMMQTDFVPALACDERERTRTFPHVSPAHAWCAYQSRSRSRPADAEARTKLRLAPAAPRRRRQDRPSRTRAAARPRPTHVSYFWLLKEEIPMRHIIARLQDAASTCVVEPRRRRARDRGDSRSAAEAASECVAGTRKRTAREARAAAVVGGSVSEGVQRTMSEGVQRGGDPGPEATYFFRGHAPRSIRRRRASRRLRGASRRSTGPRTNDRRRSRGRRRRRPPPPPRRWRRGRRPLHRSRRAARARAGTRPS